MFLSSNPTFINWTRRSQDLEVAYRTPHGRRITLHRQSGYVEGALWTNQDRDGKYKPLESGDLTKKK